MLPVTLSLKCSEPCRPILPGQDAEVAGRRLGSDEEGLQADAGPVSRTAAYASDPVRLVEVHFEPPPDHSQELATDAGAGEALSEG